MGCKYMNKEKDKLTTFILCVFLGCFGFHELYLGRIKMFVIKLLTLNFFGIGWIFDVFKHFRAYQIEWQTLNGNFDNSYSSKTMPDAQSIEEYYAAEREADLQAFYQSHDFSTVESIRRIPVSRYYSATNTPSGEDCNSAYYLQRLATRFKKSGRMDLAIACLEKSNELMLSREVHLLKKDYMRFINFLRNDGQNERADTELKKLEDALPEVFHGDKTLNPQIAKVTRTDLIYLIGSRYCPYCSIYTERVYSLSGKDHRFPPFSRLPDDLKVVNCPECGSFLAFGPYYNIYGPGSPELKNEIVKSNRPFIDLRSPEIKAEEEARKSEEQKLRRTREEFSWISENLSDIAPKSIAGYSRMKKAKSNNFMKIVSAAENLGYKIEFEDSEEIQKA